jgi:hypothetical protein
MTGLTSSSLSIIADGAFLINIITLACVSPIVNRKRPLFLPQFALRAKGG